MFRLLTGAQLEAEPGLAHSMFTDRADQFHRRLKWSVSVNEFGEERDEFDHHDASYIVGECENGQHLASMRLLPTTGPTLVSEHFRHLLKNVDVVSPRIWECSRFCVSSKANQGSAVLALFQAGAAALQHLGLLAYVAVFDPRMERLYRRYGLSPEIIGSAADTQGNMIKIGLWNDSEDMHWHLESQLVGMNTPITFFGSETDKSLGH